MASGSRGRGQESAGSDALDTLTSPDLAHLPAVDLVVRLNRDDRSGTDFADIALVHAVRERRLAEAEDRVRAVDLVAAGLRDKIRALELRAANAEALARRKRNRLGSDESNSGGISGGERAVAREDDHQSQAAALEPQIQAVERTGGEIRARDVTASIVVPPELPAGEIEDGQITTGVCFGSGAVKATPAEVGDNMARPSPLRRIGATLPAASSIIPHSQLALAKERAVKRVVVEQAAGVVESRDEVSEVVAGKRKQQEQAVAASAFQCKEQQPLKKKPKPAGALGVAYDSESEDSDTQVEEAEAQGWERLNILKAQVAAWESEYDAADAAKGMLQLQAAAATPPPVAVEEVQTTVVARFQEKMTLFQRRLDELMDRADRFSAEITEWKEKTEAVLWEKILLARTTAAIELEVWKHSAEEAQAQIRAASATVARLCHEVKGWKHIASETKTCLDTQDKIIAILKDNVVEGERKLVNAECQIRLSDEHAARLENKIKVTKQECAIEMAAQARRATMIEEDLREKIRALELKVTNLEARGSGSDISRSDSTVDIDERGKSPKVSEIGARRVVPTGATTNINAQRQKGVSFYDKVYKSEMEKRKLIGNEEKELSLKKEAAIIASKELYRRCWSQAPYLPSHMEDDSGEDDSSEDDSGEDDSSEDDSGEEA